MFQRLMRWLCGERAVTVSGLLVPLTRLHTRVPDMPSIAVWFTVRDAGPDRLAGTIYFVDSDRPPAGHIDGGAVATVHKVSVLEEFHTRTGIWDRRFVSDAIKEFHAIHAPKPPRMGTRTHP